MSQKILITGATGNYGGGIAKGLAATGSSHNVAELVRDKASEKSKILAAQGFELRTGSYSDPASLEVAFQGIDVLFFVSASDIEGRWAQHLNVLKAAEKAGVGHIVYTSAGYKNTATDGVLYPVMSAHIETEKWLHQSGILYTILKHNLYAEVIPMFVGDKNALAQSKTLFFPASYGMTAFVARQDLVEAGLKILSELEKHANKVYNLNGSANYGFEQIAAEITKITGSSVGYVSPTLTEFESTMSNYGVPSAIIGLMLMFARGIAEGEFETHHSDLPIILGHAPTALPAYLEEVYG